MTSSKIVHLLTFALAVSTFTGSARADLYASYDPSNPSVTFPTSVVAETTSSEQNIYGTEFSPILTGQVTSLTAAIAVDNLVSNAPGANTATFQFNLFAGPAVDPFNDTPIDTFTKVIDTPGGAITSFTFSSTKNPILTVGQMYWIYMGTSPGEAQPLVWGVPSSTGVTGNVDDASFNYTFPNTTNHSFTTETQPAFVIDGVSSTATTPEPGYAILVGFGIFLLFVLRLRMRRKCYRF